MSQGAGRSDLLSLKRELLDSARLDEQPLPASVRKQVLLAATVAGVASASAGTATAAGASAAIGTSTSVTLGLAKLGGIGALLVSAGTATYYGTAGAWKPARATGSSPSAEIHTVHRAPSPRAPTVPSVTLSGARTLGDVPLPNARPLEHVPPPSATSLTPELRDVTSTIPRVLPSMAEAVPQSVGTSPAADAAGSDSMLPSTPMHHSKLAKGGRHVVSVQPTSPEGAPTPLEPSPGSTRGIQPSHETLSEELALLDSARARLAAGDASGTLWRLDEYAQGFARGALQPEAMFLRVQALYQAGQHSAAAQVSRHFLNQYPTSPHADRVRALMESHADDQNP